MGSVRSGRSRPGRAGGAGHRGAQAFGEAAIHEQLWVDPVREVADLLERLVHVAGELLEHGPRPDRIGLGELARQPQVDRERDQVLLRSVMEVALDPASLRVPRGHHAGPRGA